MRFSDEHYLYVNEFVISAAKSQLFCITQLDGPINVGIDAAKLILTRPSVSLEATVSQGWLGIDQIHSSLIDCHRIPAG